MKAAIFSAVGLALLATCAGLPVVPNVGIDITQGDLRAWQGEFIIGGQPLLVGLGWQKDGTISAGARLNGQQVPLSAAISTNVNDLKQLKYQLGTKVGDLAGAVYGDSQGKISYVVNGLTAINDNDKIGASLEGDLTKPATLTAAVHLGKEVIQGKVNFGDNLAPENFNVQMGLAQ